MNNIKQTICEVAISLIGLQEKKNNSGFHEFPKPFIELLKSTGLSVQSSEDVFKMLGWKKGYAWCDYAAELVYYTAYTLSNTIQGIHTGKLFTGSAIGTLKSFKKDGWEFSEKPVKGGLVFWKKKGHSWHGHIGICIETNEDSTEFKTVEGNTGVNGSREGTGMFEKENNIYSRGSLEFKGCIIPKSI